MRMNAELLAIQENLKCGHCGARFKGSESQAWKTKYERRVTYCSDTCRKASLSRKAQEQSIKEGKKPRKGILAGPCKTCGNMFESKYDKLFCSMSCYTKSEQYQQMLAENRKKIISKAPDLTDDMRAQIAAKQRLGMDVPCLECGTEFYQKRPTKSKPARKFCSRGCYRTYLAKRFDRWVANPEDISIMQCYDEFLDREELSCVVEGCNWHGQWLTLHMNQAHGVRSEEFKRAAGFNLSTGVIAKPLAQALSQRAIVGVALKPHENALERAREALARTGSQKDVIRYQSRESREHQKKVRSMWGVGPQRICKWCGNGFQQSTPAGRTLYCSKKCRNAFYYAEGKRTDEIERMAGCMIQEAA